MFWFIISTCQPYKSQNKVMVSGVTRGKGRGIPKCGYQKPVSKPADFISVGGCLKAAVVEGDKECPELVPISVYNNKPVHFLSMGCDEAGWVEKT